MTLAEAAEADYAKLQAKAVSGKLSEAGWARLWAAARARGEYPPLVCKTEARARKPQAEPEAGL